MVHKIGESSVYAAKVAARAKLQEDVVKHLRKILTFSATILSLLAGMPVVMYAQMSNVKTLWVILMENHNWTGNNSGAAFGAPDIKGSPLAPYANGQLLNTSTRGAVL